MDVIDSLKAGGAILEPPCPLRNFLFWLITWKVRYWLRKLLKCTDLIVSTKHKLLWLAASYWCTHYSFTHTVALTTPRNVSLWFLWSVHCKLLHHHYGNLLSSGLHFIPTSVHNNDLCYRSVFRCIYQSSVCNDQRLGRTSSQDLNYCGQVLRIA